MTNLNVLSILTMRFDEYFGFTDKEVKGMLEYYGRVDQYSAVEEWYDGYRIGNMDFYCPWDVISYCYELIDNLFAEPKDYWFNTSGNDIVRHFIKMQGNGVTKGKIEALVVGETVIKEIKEDMIWSIILTELHGMAVGLTIVITAVVTAIGESRTIR